MTEPGRLSEEVLPQVLAIEPSNDGYANYRPARVTLSSGEVLDRVYCVDADEHERAYAQGRGGFKDHRLEGSVPAGEAVRVEESPYRLPPALANEVYAAGESGMGYTVFTLRLKDGRRLPRVVGNYVDFPALPEGVATADIKEVTPHLGRDEFRDRDPEPCEQSAPYEWLFYRA